MALKLAKQLGAIWRRLGTGRRVSILAATFGLVAGFGALVLRAMPERDSLADGNFYNPEASKVITALAALNVEQMRMKVISENIANAQTTRGLDGKAYQRQIVVLEPAHQPAMNGDSAAPAHTLRMAHIATDSRPPRKVFAPGNPDADDHGLVSLPNISIEEELAEMNSASRSFETNMGVVKKYARTMALQTLAMGRH